MPHRVRAAQILDEWRRVERQYLIEPEGPESERLVGELARLREDYLETIRQASLDHLPVPPPFPASGEPPRLA